MRSIITSLVFVVSLSGCTDDEPTVVGTWNVTAVNGEARTDLTYAFTDTVSALNVLGHYAVPYTVNESVSPHQIDFHPGQEDIGALGIFEITGDTLLLKYSDGEASHTRPTNFDIEPAYDLFTAVRAADR